MIKFHLNLNFCLLLINLFYYDLNGQVLNPPYFNIAEGRKIVASATCGEEGMNFKKELYCRLDGSTMGYEKLSSSSKIIKGQHCDYCDSNDPQKSHKAEYITDGTGRWWQSPPLSRNLNLTYVTLTLDLNQEFHIAYILLKMGNSPRPDVWVLERSVDLGKTWKPWQYFASTKDQCIKFFGKESIKPITRENSVICETQFSKIVPLENGEITITLIKDRPGSSSFTTSAALQEWSKATNIRLRFLRPKTTSEDLIEGSFKDPTVTRRYFYSLKDMNIGGRCVCNGHADNCLILDSTEPFKLYCSCKHNTSGLKCEYCKEGYVQKKWRPSTANDHFFCEKCNCFNHSEICIYDEEVDKQNKSLDLNNQYSGGGVCQNCRDNTAGINCHKCVDGYYRKANVSLISKDVCTKCVCNEFYHTGKCAFKTGVCECKENFQPPKCDKCSFGYYDSMCKPCECYINGTTNSQCKLVENIEKQCDCKENFSGPFCKECNEKYYDFPNCTSCKCDIDGALDNICDKKTGKCKCKNSFGGIHCNECDTGYFYYPQCSKCECDVTGTNEQICNKKTGECLCKEGYYGKYCNSCAPNFYGYPNCQPCNCYESGSFGPLCSNTGKCTCLSNYDGQKCNKCKPGFFYDSSDNSCVPCNCDSNGSLGVTCNVVGKCFCRENFDGEKCEVCKKDFFNYPFCERCDCDPNGIKESFTGCTLFSTVKKLCDCKPLVVGRKCNQCKSLYWNLNKFNPRGCQDCQCNTNGTIASLGNCNEITGQCNCKANIESRICNDCKDGYYNLDQSNLFGCSSCECSPYGSDYQICAKNTGQCRCKPKVYGRTCDRPNKIHYFPTLYQFQYEVEDGLTPQNTQARYDFNESIFQGFSWKGYVNFDNIQKELILDVNIEQTSIYKTVFHYKNPSKDSITGSIKFIDLHESEQKINLIFEPTGDNPKKFLPIGKIGTNNVFSLSSGKWKVSITVEKPMLIDYFVLLPKEYWVGQNFFQFNESPCYLLKNVEENNFCKQYAYPSYPLNSTILKSESLKVYKNIDLLEKLLPDKANKNIFLIDNHFQYNFKPKISGKQVLLLSYHDLDLFESNDILKQIVRTLKFFLKKINSNELVSDSENNKDLKKINLSLYNNFDYKISNDNITYLKLHHCPYAFPCKQILITNDFDFAVFDLNKEEEYNLNIRIDNIEYVKTDIFGLIDIVFIPIEQFSLDLIRGDILCSQNINKQCQENQLTEIENSYILDLIDRTDDKNKNTLFNSFLTMNSVNNINNQLNLSEYMFINTEILTNIAQGNVTKPKLYTLIVDYYQPLHASFEVDSSISLTNGNTYLNKIPIKYCPNIGGCRTQILTLTNRTLFELSESFDLAMKVPAERSFYLKKIFFLNNENFNLNILYPQTIKKPEIDFIKTCAQDAYYIDADLYNKYWNQTLNNFENILEKDREKISKFCRDTIFGLTIKFNKGALLCRCNSHGSLSHECAQFGGQCKCKPNVIGRTCSACKTGYYGFPDCKPCNCPSTAYCEPKTGKCVCPPRVSGSKCEKCVNLTWGYHKINGCEECECHEYGVEKGNLQCDIHTGQCKCKKNFSGRRCNYCINGFHLFPKCILCLCDKRGASEKICDEKTGKCYCKPNVIGENCEQCKKDSFNLDENNSMGCSKCWCSGVSTKCRSADLYYKLFIDMSNNNSNSNRFKWSVLKLLFKSEKNIQEQFITTDLDFYDNKIKIPISKIQADALEEDFESLSGYYVSLPISYLGKKITSYGGKFSYLLIHELSEDYKNIFSVPDIILRSQNKTIIYDITEQPVSPDEPFSINLFLTEKSFKNLDGSPVTRNQFMMILMNITAFYIKAAYFQQTKEVTFKNIALEIGTNDNQNKSNNLTLNVEHCFCPKGYTGISCEQCESGFYRVKVNSNLFHCLPCNCNQHSKECDVDTGKCFNCKHNTIGDHCEKCAEGYHGDAKIGSVDDCLICPCPLPLKSNNFAINCSLESVSHSNPDFLNQFNFKCNCKPGYKGNSCNKCQTGFYGQPQYQNDYCKPCNCSGNADLNVEGVCDSITGECLKCENNTSGYFCHICKDNYYGDAVNEKNCKQCSCSKCGSFKCNNKNGTCNCKKNIIGEHCDQCEENHWSFNQCSGCIPCNCGKASNSSQCDLIKGTCICKPGATGQYCEKCEHGYWNYTSEGCNSCNCTKEFSYGNVCNEIGQCECLPGVIGEKCDRCPDRWVFIPKIGCKKCENCVHGLLDDTDQLTIILDSIMKEMTDSSSSLLQNRKLSRINDTVVKFKNRLAELIDKIVNNKKILLTFNESFTKTRDLESFFKKLTDYKKNLIDTSNQLIKETFNNLINLNKQYLDIYNVKNKLISEIEWIKSLVYTLAPIKTNEESLIEKSHKIITKLKTINLTNDYNNILNHSKAANELLEKIIEFEKPWKKTQNDIKIIVKKFDFFNELLQNLKEWIKESSSNTDQFQQSNLTLKNSYDLILLNNKKTNSLNSTINDLLNKANELIEKSKSLLTENFVEKNDNQQYDLLKKKYNELNSQKIILNKTNSFFTNLVNNASNHSTHLLNQSLNFTSLFNKTKNYAESSIKAANSYLEMTKAIDNSLSFIENALEVIKEVNNMFQKKPNAKYYNSISYKLKNKANLNEANVNNQLEPSLKKSLNKLTEFKKNLQLYYNKHQKIQTELQTLINQEFREQSEETLNLSENVTNFLDNSFKNLKKFIDLKDIITSKDTMKSRYPTLNNAIKSSVQYYERLDNYISQLKNISQKLTKYQLSNEKLQNNVKDNFDTLKKLIKTARATSNRIDLGLKIKPNTYVELRTPENLLKPGTYTKFSFNFRSQTNDGFLAYLGNPKSIKSSVNNEYIQKKVLNDYLALEIRDKRVNLIIEIGGSPLVVANPLQIKLNTWYFVEVEIIGKHVTLKLKSSDEIENVVSSHIVGTFSVFDLDVRDSKLFVGGISNKIELQDKIENTKFLGEIQNLNLNDVKLGLWNFVNGEVNTEGTKKNFMNSDKNLSVKFNGKGYIMIKRNKRYDFRQQTNLILSFKTLSENGLIFLIKGNKHFLAIQILNGKLVVIMKLNKKVVISSLVKINNNTLKKVELNRIHKEIMVKLDEVEIGFAISEGENNNLEVNDNIYIGGNPEEQKHNNLLTNYNFNGCLIDFQIEAVLINLEKDAFEVIPGVEFGCSNSVIREIMFEKPGYITMPLLNEINQISFKFRTKDKNALLFYASNKNNTEYIGIYFKDNNLIFHSEPGDKINTSVTYTRNFNDNRWHYLTATRTNLLMRLDLDDKFNYQPEKLNNLRLKNDYHSLDLNDGLVYFGGVQPNKQSLLENFEIPISMIGCLGDVNLNEAFQNFALSKNYANVQLTSCVKDKSDNFLDDKNIIDNADSTISTTSSTTTSTNIDDEITTTMTTLIKSNIPVKGCKLPIIPNKSTNFISNSLKFGLTPNSRHIFYLSQDVIKRLEITSKFSLKFKTDANDGLLFYVGDENINDYVLIYLKKGAINFVFNCGSGSVKLVTEKTYNDDEWHTVTASRDKTTGFLLIDEKENKTGSTPGKNSKLNLNSFVYIGGLTDELVKKINLKLKTNYLSLKGCIERVQILETLYDFKDGESFDQVENCVTELKEPGLFFSGNSYVKSKQIFKIENEIKITMQLKPRNMTGLILYIGSTSENYFLMLEIIDGTLKVTVMNGEKPFTGEIKKDIHNLCDGDWHNIQLIKMANVVILYLDSFTTSPIIQNSQLKLTKTDSSLYLGGHHIGGIGEIDNAKWNPVLFSNYYAGCIKDFKIQSKTYENYTDYKFNDENSNIAYGDIDFQAGCPTI